MANSSEHTPAQFCLLSYYVYQKTGVEPQGTKNQMGGKKTNAGEKKPTVPNGTLTLSDVSYMAYLKALSILTHGPPLLNSMHEVSPRSREPKIWTFFGFFNLVKV